MLKRIELHRFRSILHTEITLSESSLTVLVGANGSGKTNIVKALDFISTMNRDGLQSAVFAQGGREGVLSKSVAAHKAHGATTAVQYTCALSPPRHYPKAFPPPEVEHRIEIEWQGRTKFRVKEEWVKFTEVLHLGKCFRLVTEGTDNSGIEEFQNLPEDHHRPSSITLTRGENSSLHISFDPEPCADDVGDCLHWLGLFVSEVTEEVKTVEEFKDILKRLYAAAVGDLEEKKLPKTSSFIDPEALYLFQIIRQMSVFRRLMRNTKRYDIQLSQLRQEQQGSVTSEMGGDGSNLPSAYQELGRTERGKRAQRIMHTLRAIAPEILRGKLRTLRTGKQLVEFIESETGRPVESWHCADGTLRTLAILVAIETHPAGGTVVIEEPERCLHPWAVRCLVDHMRTVIEERKLQVILTTHSEHLLECLEPDELLVLERDPQKGTQVRPLREVVPSHTIEMGDVGRLWVQGLLGGVPTYGEREQ